MRFVDANIFIKWITARKKSLSLESAISGYILRRIRDGELAVTTTLVKDEVMIWLSRYRASELVRFIRAIRALASLKIVCPTLEDEENAAKMIKDIPLGFSDLVNLAVMKRFGISEIYTLDKGFLRAGVKVIFWDLKDEPGFQEFIEELKSAGFSIVFDL